MFNGKAQGVVVPLITPIDEEERIQYEYLGNVTEYVIEGGVDAIFVMGTTGEFARFDNITRASVIAYVVKKVNGRVPVYAGVSDTGTHNVIKNIKLAEEAGANVLVSTLPYYFPTVSETESYDFFKDIAKSTKLPIMIYNIPATCGTKISLSTIDRLYPIENIIGVKDSCGDEFFLMELIKRFKGLDKNFSILVGEEKLIYNGLKAGVDGIVPSLANPFPKLLSAAYKSSLEEKEEKLKYYSNMVNSINSLNQYCDSWMSPNIWRKRALELMGVSNSCFTKPYQPVDKNTDEKIWQVINEYNSIFC